MTILPFIRVGRLGLIASILPFFSATAFSQVVVVTGPTPAPSESSVLVQFDAEQEILGQDSDDMVSQGASLTDLSDWMQQSALAFQSQQGLALQLGTQSALQAVPVDSAVSIPVGASSDMISFLDAQVAINVAEAQIHNQLVLQGTGSGPTESALMAQDEGSALQSQAALAQQLTSEEDTTALPTPDSLVIPAGSSPTMQTFLTLQYQLAVGEIQVHNAYLSADEPTRMAALVSWRQTNAASYQQLQNLGQQLAGAAVTLVSNPTPVGSPAPAPTSETQ